MAHREHTHTIVLVRSMANDILEGQEPPHMTIQGLIPAGIMNHVQSSDNDKQTLFTRLSTSNLKNPKSVGAVRSPSEHTHTHGGPAMSKGQSHKHILNVHI